MRNLVEKYSRGNEMTVTSSGIKCDVCGTFILGLTEDDVAYPFSLACIVQQMHACNKCIEIIKTLDKKQGGDGDWKKLPEGPLRKFFEENAQIVEEESG